jgi:hypothetical protein
MHSFSKYITITSCIVITGSVAAITADDAESQARAAYPKPFSRPSSMGKDYDTWRDATGPDIGETSVDISRLPSRVDNSARPQFPPIYSQKWGECGQYTAIASIFTYEMNVLNGTTATTAATQFPADFSWNMANNAKNNGSEAYNGWETAKRIGIPTVKSYGGVQLYKIGAWPNGYATWREAMEYRVSGYRYTPVATIAQINEARGWLFDRNQPKQGAESIGGLFALDGRMGDRAEMKKITKTIPEGEYLAGEDLWSRWCSSGNGHGITCVGYDDNVGYDLNGDGKITNDIDINGDGKVTLADRERGAFIVVNSWGKNWSRDGRIYLLYSAMVDPTWERGNFLGRIEVYRHIPRCTLKLKLTCNNRSNLRVTIGIAGDKDATKPEHEFAPEALNGWPLFGKENNVGNVPLAGPDDNSPLELGVDLTPLLSQLPPIADGNARLFLRFSSKEKSKTIGVLNACAIRTYDPQGSFVSESVVDIEDGNFGTKPLKLETTIQPLLPRRTITPD